jgi:hypothetical protein
MEGVISADRCRKKSYINYTTHYHIILPASTQQPPSTPTLRLQLESTDPPLLHEESRIHNHTQPTKTQDNQVPIDTPTPKLNCRFQKGAAIAE